MELLMRGKKNREQGTGSKEQGAGNREQGAGSAPLTPHSSFLTPHSPNQRLRTEISRNIVLIALFFLLSSCTSMIQKSGEVLEGSSFEEMNLGIYRSSGNDSEAKIELRELVQKNGEIALEMSSSAWPGFALRGSRPDGRGNFELTGCRVLSSHVHGWNEFTMDIFGKAIFDNPKKTGAVLYIAGNVERVQISSGKIRLKSERLTGAAALTPLRNRRERILALVEWMNEKAESGEVKTVFSGRKEFEKYWKSLLFPELVSKSKRPPGYTTKNAERKRVDGVKWNRTYTESLFPEGLWEFRNSGALLRDWEEALYWIYIEYSWNHITSSFNDTNLIKIK